MNKQTRTLLRAAYIAILIDNDRHESFGSGQLKILRKPLKQKKWPISVEKDSELADVVNAWFEGNFVTTVKEFPDSENQAKLEILTNLIRHAAGIPRSEAGIIKNWIFKELIEQAQKQVELFKNKQNNGNLK